MSIGTISLFELLWTVFWASGVPIPTAITARLSEQIRILCAAPPPDIPPLNDEERSYAVRLRKSFRYATLAIALTTGIFSLVGLYTCFRPNTTSRMGQEGISETGAAFLLGALAVVVLKNTLLVLSWLSFNDATTAIQNYLRRSRARVSSMRPKEKSE